MEKTVIEQLAAAQDALKAFEAKLATAQSEASIKIAALEKNVTDLTADRDTHKAASEKAAAELKAATDAAAVSAKTAGELTEKVKGLEARLADPSFKAASTPGTEPVPVGGKVQDAPLTLKELEAAYMAEKDETKLGILRAQIFEMQKTVK